MKTVAVIFASLAASTAAFTSNKAASPTKSALSAEPIGVAKFPGFLGKTEWNRLTTEWGTEDTGKYMQAA